jgi:hypothetical protein
VYGYRFSCHFTASPLWSVTKGHPIIAGSRLYRDGDGYCPWWRSWGADTDRASRGVNG